MMDGIYVHILIILGMGTQKHEHSIISLSPSYLSLTLSFHWKIYHRKRSGMGGGRGTGQTAPGISFHLQLLTLT